MGSRKTQPKKQSDCGTVGALLSYVTREQAANMKQSECMSVAELRRYILDKLRVGGYRTVLVSYQTLRRLFTQDAATAMLLSMGEEPPAINAFLKGLEPAVIIRYTREDIHTEIYGGRKWVRITAAQEFACDT